MNPCILMPTYNDRGTLAPMVERLLPFGFPVIIVNDGSNDTASAAIRSICETHREIIGIHRPLNGGKGAAVIDGIAAAREHGYSHVLQIDSDDQHCIEDIPRFIEAARLSPDALILGTPVFSADVPTGRLIGRQISRFWVALETLSRSIHDPLFGYRVYPTIATNALLKRVRLGHRMDFDPEVAVRLYWEGLNIVTLKTVVRYPEGGQSSFRMLKDNLLISWMHTRLFLGMLLRIPRLIRRWF